MQNARLSESQAGIKIAKRNINQDAGDLGWVEHGLLKYTEYNRRLRKQSLLPE